MQSFHIMFSFCLILTVVWNLRGLKKCDVKTFQPYITTDDTFEFEPKHLFFKKYIKYDCDFYENIYICIERWVSQKCPFYMYFLYPINIGTKFQHSTDIDKRFFFVDLIYLKFYSFWTRLKKYYLFSLFNSYSCRI